MHLPSSNIGVTMAVLALSLSGCEKKAPPDSASQSVPPSVEEPRSVDHRPLKQDGYADASVAYWNSFNTQRPDWTDIRQAFEGWALGSVNEEVQLIRTDGFCFFMIQSLIEQNEGLGQLPMKDVDPALLAFTAEMTTFNGLRIEILGEARSLTSQIQNLTSPSRLGLDLLGSFFRHAEDENPFEGMLKDQWSEKSKTLGETIPLANQLEARIQGLAPLQAKITAAEVSVRATLHKNHNREFKPSSSFRNDDPNPTELEKVFTKRRIVLDLLGQKFDGWTFDNISEIKDIRIEKLSRKDSHAGILVECDVVGMHSGNRRVLDPLLIYEQRGMKWVLLGLTPKPFNATAQ